MKKHLKSLAQLVQATSTLVKSLRGRDADVLAYLVALAAIAAATHIGIRFMELQAGIV